MLGVLGGQRYTARPYLQTTMTGRHLLQAHEIALRERVDAVRLAAQQADAQLMNDAKRNADVIAALEHQLVVFSENAASEEVLRAQATTIKASIKTSPENSNANQHTLHTHVEILRREAFARLRKSFRRRLLGGAFVSWRAGIDVIRRRQLLIRIFSRQRKHRRSAGTKLEGAFECWKLVIARTLQDGSESTSESASDDASDDGAREGSATATEPSSSRPAMFVSAAMATVREHSGRAAEGAEARDCSSSSAFAKDCRLNAGSELAAKPGPIAAGYSFL